MEPDSSGPVTPKPQSKRKKLYGEYRCQCGRIWTSKYSFRQQKCWECKAVVKPCKQQPKQERLYGEYRCPNCKRLWMSSLSWPGYGQECKKCKVMVNPFKQCPLEAEDTGIEKINRKKRHPQELCGKCKALGRYCTTDSVYIL